MPKSSARSPVCQHLQGRGARVHLHSGRQMAPTRDHGLRDLSRLLSHRDGRSGDHHGRGLEGANDRAPLGRLGDEEDLKGITLLRASDAGTHVTGQALAVDGGVSVARGLNSTPTEISL